MKTRARRAICAEEGESKREIEMGDGGGQEDGEVLEQRWGRGGR